MRHHQPQAGGDNQARRHGRDAAQHVLQYADLGVVEKEGAEREARRPRDQDEAGERRQRAEGTAELRPDAHRDRDDVGAGEKLAEAQDVGEFAVPQPAVALDQKAPRPDDRPAKAAQRDQQKAGEERRQRDARGAAVGLGRRGARHAGVRAQAKARRNAAATARCAFIASSTAGTMPKKAWIMPWYSRYSTGTPARRKAAA